MSNENVDNIIAYTLIKRIVTPFVKTEAYRMGLINNAGRVIKSPQTDEERSALTVLDRLVFKLKRLLGRNLIKLNSFLYLTTLSNDFYNKLIVRGSVQQRAEVLRIRKDIERLAEENDSDVQGVLETLLVEEIQKGDTNVL